MHLSSISTHSSLLEFIYTYLLNQFQHTIYFPLLIFPTLCMATIHKPHKRHNESYILILPALAIPLHLKYDYHVPILSQNPS